jgi:hypothetical protein
MLYDKSLEFSEYYTILCATTIPKEDVSMGPVKEQALLADGRMGE